MANQFVFGSIVVDDSNMMGDVNYAIDLNVDESLRFGTVAIATLSFNVFDKTSFSVGSQFLWKRKQLDHAKDRYLNDSADTYEPVGFFVVRSVKKNGDIYAVDCDSDVFDIEQDATKFFSSVNWPSEDDSYGQSCPQSDFLPQLWNYLGISSTVVTDGLTKSKNESWGDVYKSAETDIKNQKLRRILEDLCASRMSFCAYTCVVVNGEYTPTLYFGDYTQAHGGTITKSEYSRLEQSEDQSDLYDRIEWIDEDDNVLTYIDNLSVFDDPEVKNSYQILASNNIFCDKKHYSDGHIAPSYPYVHPLKYLWTKSRNFAYFSGRISLFNDLRLGYPTKVSVSSTKTLYGLGSSFVVEGKTMFATSARYSATGSEIASEGAEKKAGGPEPSAATMSMRIARTQEQVEAIGEEIVSADGVTQEELLEEGGALVDASNVVGAFKYENIAVEDCNGEIHEVVHAGNIGDYIAAYLAAHGGA